MTTDHLILKRRSANAFQKLTRRSLENLSRVHCAVLTILLTSSMSGPDELAPFGPVESAELLYVASCALFRHVGAGRVGPVRAGRVG